MPIRSINPIRSPRHLRSPIIKVKNPRLNRNTSRTTRPLPRNRKLPNNNPTRQPRISRLSSSTRQLNQLALLVLLPGADDMAKIVHPCEEENDGCDDAGEDDAEFLSSC